MLDTLAMYMQFADRHCVWEPGRHEDAGGTHRCCKASRHHCSSRRQQTGLLHILSVNLLCAVLIVTLSRVYAQMYIMYTPHQEYHVNCNYTAIINYNCTIIKLLLIYSMIT